MKTETTPSDDLNTLGELIDGIEIAMLTTRAADGSLVSRPLQTLQFDRKGDLHFFTAADSAKIEQLLRDPEVNLAYAHPGTQRYVSVRGTAFVTRDRARIDALWSFAQKPFFPDGKDDPNLVVLSVRVRDADYWEAPSNFVSRALDFTRAIVSDEPADLGTHGRVAGLP
ncbi:pyridoxamine 5'-phosphate oxidase family protein [Dokdonella sp. MW10]|uniref:pyridoxamine 5'-phosphate oxidase family protein n=1 Tax=Dokdonella sp. MW10 TaxID=2992926 RepID=UPI003F7E95CD